MASVSAVPGAGYGFVSWTETGVVVSTSPNYNFTAAANRALVANFTAAYSITTTASPGYGGATSGGGIYNSNDTVTVAATPALGYNFVNWTEFGTAASAAASYTFTASASRNLVASFAGAGVTSVFNFDPGNPAVSAHQGLPGFQVDNGLTAYFSAPLGAYSVQQYVFYTWIPASFSGLFLLPNTWGSTLQLQFDQAITNFSFCFATDDLAADVDTPSLVQISAYTNSGATPLGSVSGRGAWSSGSYPEGTLTFSSATPFNRVLLSIPSGQTASLLFVDNLVAQRAPPPAFTIDASGSPPDGGTVSGAGAYSSGEMVTLTATPNTGYVFVNWTEAGLEVSASASYSFAATSGRALVANFARACSILAGVSPAGSGTVAGGGLYATGSIAVVTATANPGYAFVNWMENGVRFSTWPGCYVVACSNRTLVANFAPACILTTGSAATNAGLASGGGIYPAGSAVATVATPKTGYRFLDWLEKGVPVSSSPCYYFTAATNRALTAEFVPDYPSVTFDFDTATPALTNDQHTPLAQTARGLTAAFSSTNDPAYCIGSDATLFWSMSRFSSDYLFTCFTAGALDIRFSRPVNSIALTFATPDFQEILTPSTIEMTAYQEPGATPVGTVAASGTYNPVDTTPMGWIGLRSTVPFNRVTLSLPPAPMAATDLLVDNITVTTPAPQLSIARASPNRVLVSWTTNADGYVLQERGDLAAGNWLDATNVATVVGDQYQLGVTPPAGNRFYRLFHP